MDRPRTTYGEKQPLQNSPNMATRGKAERRKTKNTWRRTVEHERKEMGTASWEIARNVAMDRTGWRKRILASCA